MFGYETPAPKLWKALLGAGIIVFPLFYVADAAILHHQPGWVYVLASCAATLLFGYQMYSGGPQGLALWGRSSGTSSAARSLIPKNDGRSRSDLD